MIAQKSSRGSLQFPLPPCKELVHRRWVMIALNARRTLCSGEIDLMSGSCLLNRANACHRSRSKRPPGEALSLTPSRLPLSQYTLFIPRLLHSNCFPHFISALDHNQPFCELDLQAF